MNQVSSSGISAFSIELRTEHDYASVPERSRADPSPNSVLLSLLSLFPRALIPPARELDAYPHLTPGASPPLLAGVSSGEGKLKRYKSWGHHHLHAGTHGRTREGESKRVDMSGKTCVILFSSHLFRLGF
jgi:hypothetical protein